MNGQNNNDIFGNMIQPNVIPETKDNSGMVGSNVNNSLNQSNNSFLGVPQSNTVSSSVVGDGMVSQNNNVGSISSGDIGTNNNLVNNGLVSDPVNLNSNGVLNNSSLDFNANNNPSFNNLNMNTQTNTSVDVNSNLNNMVQPSLKSVNDTINFEGDNIGVSPLSTNGDNVGVVKNDSNVSDNKEEVKEEVVSVKKYLIHMLLCCIPLVGIIILIMRALDRKDKNISNLARAQLLISAIVVLLSVVMMFVIGSLMTSLFSNSLY